MHFEVETSYREVIGSSTGPTMEALFGDGDRNRDVFMVGPKRDHPAGERRLN